MCSFVRLRDTLFSFFIPQLAGEAHQLGCPKIVLDHMHAYIYIRDVPIIGPHIGNWQYQQKILVSNIGYIMKSAIFHYFLNKSISSALRMSIIHD